MRVSSCTVPEGTVVRAVAGRDSERMFLTVRPQEGPYLFLADGILRPVTTPKRKNVRHIRVVGRPDDADAVLKTLREPGDNGAKNAALRACIARFMMNCEKKP